MDSLSLAWSPLVPWALLAGLALAALGVSLLAAWRGAGWSLLPRGLFLLLLLLLLANPSMLREQRVGLPDIAVVVVDESPSQQIGDRPVQTAAAAARLDAQLKKLPNTESRIYRAEAPAPGDGDTGTQLFAKVQQALGEISRDRLAGIFLISDGQVDDVPDQLDGLGVTAPIHLLRSGAPVEWDRRLIVRQAPSFGIVGRPLELLLVVEDLYSGAPPPAGPQKIPVSLRLDGQPQQTVLLSPGEETKIQLTLAHRGPSVIELQVAPLAGELSEVNNQATMTINGVRDRLRVLLVSGEPHPGERGWRNILKSDPAVDLVHFTILRPPEKQDGTPINELSLIAFPTRELFEVKLDDFDLIIFDRYQRRGVLPTLYLENVARYVEQGGALLTALGPAFATPRSLYRTPLSRIFPAIPTGEIVEGGFYPRVTELGRRHPVTAGLPGSQPPALDGATDPPPQPGWGRWFRQVETEIQSGQVTMTGRDNLPLLILDRKGDGRVAQLTSEQIWLWSRGFEGGGPSAELIRRIAHWLMREPELEEEQLSAWVEGDRLEVRRRSLRADLPDLTVTRPDGETLQLPLQEDAPGRARAGLALRQFGLYRVSDGANTALAAAGPLNPREYLDLRSSTAPLADLIEASGGGSLFLAAQDDWQIRKVSANRSRRGGNWLGILALGKQQVTGMEKVGLLPGLLALLLLLGALLLGWRQESR